MISSPNKILLHIYFNEEAVYLIKPNFIQYNLLVSGVYVVRQLLGSPSSLDNRQRERQNERERLCHSPTMCRPHNTLSSIPENPAHSSTIPNRAPQLPQSQKGSSKSAAPRSQLNVNGQIKRLDTAMENLESLGSGLQGWSLVKESQRPRFLHPKRPSSIIANGHGPTFTCASVIQQRHSWDRGQIFIRLLWS